MKARRTKIKKAYIVSLLFLIFIVALSVIFKNWFIFNQYKKIFTGYEIDKISIDGSNYSIKNGEIYSDDGKYNYYTNPQKTKKIFSLAYFYMVVKEDPIFYSKELNINSLESEIIQIDDTQKELKNALGTKNNFIDVNFLKSILEVGKSYNNFIDNVSFENAFDLLDKYDHTLLAYKRGVEKSKEDVLSYFPYETEQDFVLLRTTTTNRVVADSLDLMIKNSERLKLDIDIRRYILSGKTVNYEQDYFLPNLFSYTYGDNKSYSKEKILSKNQVKLNPSEKITKIKGPFGAYSDCYSGENKIELFYMTISQEGRHFPRLATDIFYEKLSHQNDLYSYLIENGQEYRATKETYNYRCMNHSFIPATINMSLFIDKYSNDLIFPVLKEKLTDIDDHKFIDLLEVGEQKEKDFFSMEIPTEIDMNELSKTYFYAYTALKKENVDKKYKDELLKRYLELRNRLLGYSQIYEDRFYLDNLLTRYNLGLIKTNSQFLGHLYAVRSNFDIVYLSFSPIVWRIDEIPKYNKEIKEGFDNKSMKNLEEILQSYDLETIESWPTISDEDLFEAFKQNKGKENEYQFEENRY